MHEYSLTVLQCHEHGWHFLWADGYKHVSEDTTGFDTYAGAHAAALAWAICHGPKELKAELTCYKGKFL